MARRVKRKKDMEVDVHIWKKPEDAYMEALYTISVGKGSICYDLPIDEALVALRIYLTDEDE